jgi:dienelactone hydrolase
MPRRRRTAAWRARPAGTRSTALASGWPVPAPRRACIGGSTRWPGTRSGGGCRFPLVVFSHGHYGSPAACERLCAGLASRGFVVVAPRHADRATPRRLQGPERVEDVRFLLEHLPVVARGAGPLGVFGHSFGGRTAAEVASQDDRVRALVTMAGGADRASTALIRAPTLMVAGGADTVDPPRLSEASVRALPRSTPHALLVVPHASHGDLLTSPLVERRVAAHFAAYLRS